VLLIAAIAAGIWWRRGAEKPTRYDTVAVDKGTITARVNATGSLSARVTVQVGSQVSGRIASLDADFNSDVKKGQVIATLDPELFEAALAQARANDASARANLAKVTVQAADARRQAERAKALAGQQLVSEQDRDSAIATADAADAAVEAAKAGVAQAQAALHTAEVNLTYTRIVSPINGIVISRNVDVGQTVAASLSAPTLFVIAEDLSKMQVHASIAEADIGRIAAVKDVTFLVDAWPGRTFDGTVFQIRNSPTTVQNVVTYDTVLDVANPDLALKPGMTANISFVWAEHPDVLRIPNTALRYHPADVKPARGGPPDARTIYVLRNGKPEPVSITTGLSDGTTTEVATGDLKEGDLVVTDSDEAPSKGGGSGGNNPFRRGL
jgi:HlyD family secretion protein